MAHINRTRPYHYDQWARAIMREKAERAGTPEYEAKFLAFMHDRYMDEATIERELNRLREAVETLRLAAALDTR